MGKRKSLFVPEPEPVPKTLNHDEFKALLNACPDDRWKAICTLGYYAGLRQGEILALEWEDIDFEGRMLHIRNKKDHRTKSGKNRSVPMTIEVVAALKALQVHRFKDTRVFPNKIVKPHVSRDFSLIVIDAGLVEKYDKAKDDKAKDDKLKVKHRFTMHDLRRTFATNLLATGTDPKSVQILAGHSAVQTTLNHYAGVRAKNLTASVDKLSQLA
ncbi:MAG: site-specific integrase [Sedimentisphaerales bacterium]|nr:site-specific integrase [Sedimentisphaerales bacterium]